MRVAITGVAGFIGSHLAQRLIARGDAVAGIDNFDPFYGRDLKQRNLAAIGPQLDFVEGDITDRAGLDRFLSRDLDAVVHLAALAGVRPSIATPLRFQHVNVVGTTNLCEAMIARGDRRLVFASSSSVYGNSDAVPYAETLSCDHPASPYAASKRACELLLDVFWQLHGLSSVCLRYFTVFGPRQRPEMAIHKFSRLVEEGRPVTVFGDGRSSRDYTYIDDIIDGTVAAIDRGRAGFSIYNLGGTRPVRLDELVVRIGRALGKEPLVQRQEHQPGDVRQTWADVSAAERDLGYGPKVPLDEGLARFVAWLRGQAPW